jgi:GNAT superfamily N-acetyltransferase
MSSYLYLSSKVPSGSDKTPRPSAPGAVPAAPRPRPGRGSKVRRLSGRPPSRTLARVRAGPELLEFGKERFLAELGVLINVYAAAMQPPQHQLPGRRAIMERHAGFPSFRCVVMTLPDGSGNAPAELRTQTGRSRLTVIGFAYGFHGTSGQWWHDLVRSALASAGGRELAETWLGDSFEVAEVHVHPGYQGRGVGRTMVPALIHPRLERTALLSTQDTDSRARRLYRGLGFSDLLTDYRFPGTDPPYAVMGAALPLHPRQARGAGPGPGPDG